MTQQQPDVPMLLAQLEEAETLLVVLRNRTAHLNRALKAEHARAAALEQQLQKLTEQGDVDAS